jgi:hypothetical protein
MSSNNLRWYVALPTNDKIYYVADVDTTKNHVIWTPGRLNALSFSTDQAASEFISTYLHSRVDIHLVHGPANP